MPDANLQISQLHIGGQAVAEFDRTSRLPRGRDVVKLAFDCQKRGLPYGFEAHKLIAPA